MTMMKNMKAEKKKMKTKQHIITQTNNMKKNMNINNNNITNKMNKTKYSDDTDTKITTKKTIYIRI